VKLLDLEDRSMISAAADAAVPATVSILAEHWRHPVEAVLSMRGIRRQNPPEPLVYLPRDTKVEIEIEDSDSARAS